MTKKRGKKEKNEEKLKKIMQKDVLYKHVSSACLTGGGKQKIRDRGKLGCQNEGE